MTTTWAQTTPFGVIVITLGPNGVQRVELPAFATGSVIPGDHGPGTRPATATGPEAQIARQFDEYFDGRRTRFDVAIDLPDRLSELQRRVLTTLASDVGYGETVSYGELAEMVGRPGAARAVGSTMARNPIPFLIPCHRVVAANGIGGYGGGSAGVELKRALLRLESGDRSRY